MSRNPVKIPRTEENENVLRAFYAKETYADLAARLGFPGKAGQVRLFCQEIGVAVPRNSEMNHSFLKKVSKDRDWFLGLFISDGSIVTFNRWGNTYDRLVLSLKREDSDAVEKVRVLLGLSQEIRPDRGQFVLQWTSGEMVMDLRELGINNNKSTRLNDFNWATVSYFSHFLRGFTDGDGCISIRYDNKGRSYPSWVVLTHSSNGVFFEEMKKRLESFGVSYRLGTDNMLCIGKAGREAKSVLDFIYQGSEESIRMNRKYSKYLEALEYWSKFPFYSRHLTSD